MSHRSLLSSLIPFALEETNLEGFEQKYRGKVRDTYLRKGKRYLVTTDRLSAFDRYLTTLPAKGCILQSLAVNAFNIAKSILPVHIIDVIDPCIVVADNALVIPLEVIVRGYLAGSAWRSYKKGEAICGIHLPTGLKEFSKLETPLITPTTKALVGEHDEPITGDEIVARNIITTNQWKQIQEYALALFKQGSDFAASKGLILVDTKYEFGFVRGVITIVDEMHTLDSSRFWLMSSYESNLKNIEPPQMFDKEPIRRFLMEKGFMGDGEVPLISDEKRVEFSESYCKAYELLTGEDSTVLLKSLGLGDSTSRIELAVRQSYA